MKPHLEEALRMLQMADRDLKALEVLTADDDIHFSILCFHAQQVVEKCFKAVLYCNKVEFRRTHDLELLAALMENGGIDIPLPKADLALLGPCAVRVRYDDMETDLELLTREELHRLAKAARDWAKDVLGSLEEERN